MPAPRQDRALRDHLLYLLRGGGAHLEFERVIADFPEKLRGVRPEGGPHSGWELLEHMRIAQWDILDFSRNPEYKELEWPAGYWPPEPAPPNPRAWKKSVERFRADLSEMETLVESADLFATIPWGDGQTILREALLAADHNAYHLGQLVLVRKLLEASK
jgi:hypothetical protein